MTVEIHAKLIMLLRAWNERQKHPRQGARSERQKETRFPALAHRNRGLFALSGTLLSLKSNRV
jgi:hypothetical protein